MPIAISSMANLAIAYNLSAITIALAFMDHGSEKGITPAYPRTDQQSSILKSAIFAGAITGQLTMGYAGDVLGRRRAMLLTNSFTIFGSLGTALFTWGTTASVYTVMTICRFVLGVGVGGKYPLAGTMVRESPGKNRALNMAKGFFWQNPGAVSPYLVALLLMLTLGRENHGLGHKAATSLQFRVVLGLGALPSAAAAALCYMTAESDEFVAARARAPSSNPLRVARAHPELWGRLCGCGLSWFLCARQLVSRPRAHMPPSPHVSSPRLARGPA
jgi:PHS family inorganic phosphate transporter-like MFS transporter